MVLELDLGFKHNYVPRMGESKKKRAKQCVDNPWKLFFEFEKSPCEHSI
jgi:hypothetical protein